MEMSFYVNNNNLEKLKGFVSTLPTARYLNSPIFYGERVHFRLSLSVKDGNMLSQFQSELITKKP